MFNVGDKIVSVSNPRLAAEFPDWPLGGNRRGVCKFSVEHKPGKGFRFSRVTTGKPKTSTYGGRIAIVDGDNGRTYILQETTWGAIHVWSSDFMTACHVSDAASIPALLSLINQANEVIPN